MSFWLVDNFCNISYIAWKFCILSNEWIERNTLTFIFKPINSHIYYYFLCFSSLTDDYKSKPISDEAAITFNVVDLGTQRGKRKLVSSDGFTFTFKRQNKISTDWRCSQEQNNQLSSSGATTRRLLWCTQQQDPHPCSPTICSHSCEYS
jgi:hypothetical protein